jgi:hypothetical protein
MIHVHKPYGARGTQPGPGVHRRTERAFHLDVPDSRQKHFRLRRG